MGKNTWIESSTNDCNGWSNRFNEESVEKRCRITNHVQVVDELDELMCKRKGRDLVGKI